MVTVVFLGGVGFPTFRGALKTRLLSSRRETKG